ncbi:hypothetical protein LUZ61_008938 [Rhynchospora tenuis]|uniref:CCHC-type domain-containing protein n=1 Tax=Rhynchospora tenuis TaxID=198213 RepID=A0AAD5ZWH6_9POAL|nr:hypothetical protein LUZ61_008938 [Rhynchospora tenuis]
MSRRATGSGRRQPNPEPQDEEVNRLLSAYERGKRLAGGNHRNNEEEEFRRRFDSFARLGPPHFSGEGGYQAAEEWLAAIKSRLEVSHAPLDQHVGLATYYLVNTARFWWESTKRRFEGNAAQIPWGWFEEQFGNRFLSTMHREAMRAQFMNLRQMGRSVAEYNSLFLKWSQYAPEICDDAFRYRRQYLNGLHPDIALVIDNSSNQGIQALMDAAEQVETYRQKKAQIKGKQNRGRGRGNSGNNSGGSSGGKEQKNSSSKTTGIPYEKVWCRRCQLPHAESQCRYINQSCFRCGSPDHWARDCPQPAPVNSQGSNKPGSSVTQRQRSPSPARGRGRGRNSGGGRSGSSPMVHAIETRTEETQETERNTEEAMEVEPNAETTIMLAVGILK